MTRLRFWRWTGLIVLGNCLLIGLAVVFSSPGEIAPLAISPPPGATQVSARPAIRLSYAHTLDPASAKDVLHLDPPASGRIEVNGRELTYLLTNALAPETSYTLIVSAGLRAGGVTTTHAQTYSFRTRPSRLVVLRQEGTLQTAWIVEPATGSSRRVSLPEEDVTAVAATADGEQLAYAVRNSSDRWTLWAVDLTGGFRRALIVDQRGPISRISWSPRGDVLAFESSLVYEATVTLPRLWLAQADGTQTSLLFGRGNESGSVPTWAPDGRQLAFYDEQQRAQAVFNFTTTLITIPSALATQPSWSPVSDALAFTDRAAEDSPATLVKLIRLADGSAGARPLMQGPFSDSQPAWSPAGNWIAFTRMATEGQAVWLVQPDGSHAHPVQPPQPGWTYLTPVWAADGASLAYSRVPLRVGLSSPPQVWVTRLDGDVRQLDLTGVAAAWLP